MAAPLTTLAQVKGLLKVDAAAGSDDTFLGTLITACSDWIRSYCDRDLTNTTYLLTRRGHGGTILALPQRPVTAVASVTVGGQVVPRAASAAAAGWTVADDCVWLTGYVFVRGSVVQVAYTAGFADNAVPAGLALACATLVAWRYKDRDHTGQSSKVIGADGTQVNYQTTAMPEDVKLLLADYKRVIPA